MALPIPQNVELGFIAKPEKWMLLSHYFPSKIGGKPAWLSLKPLPGINDVKCGTCEKPCMFLTQVYAPATGKATCFHRTIFVFICKDPKCSQSNNSKNIVALRSQLAKVNDFYSDSPPNEEAFSWDSSFPSAYTRTDQNLCTVCGCLGPKRCAKCHAKSYCCKEHQVIDWKSGHKQTCGKGQALSPEQAHNTHKANFPEFEIDMDLENYTPKVEKSEDEKMKDYKEFIGSDKGSNLLGDKNIDKDLEGMAKKEGKEDSVFLTFKERMSQEQNQILRYSIGDTPLWVSSEGIPKVEDIPKCKCGSDRQFEFQIMPQLLHYLNVDSVEQSIDWGTLLVYACKDSCEIGNNYTQEFVWKQDFSKTDLTEG